jgi:hypothetical protein
VSPPNRRSSKVMQPATATVRQTCHHRRPRIILAVVAYDLLQYQYFVGLLDSVQDICISATTSLSTPKKTPPHHMTPLLEALITRLGEDAFGRYSIRLAFFSFEETHSSDKKRGSKGSQKIIWEHHWELSSTKRFAKQHLIPSYFYTHRESTSRIFMVAGLIIKACSSWPRHSSATLCLEGTTSQFSVPHVETWFLERPS